MGQEGMFVKGDFVFAKVRGYPPWPARILSVADPRPGSLKYSVFFFGTSETATVLAKDVSYYESNKEKLGKPIKRKFFKEGIEQLEEELKNAAKVDKLLNINLPSNGVQLVPIRKPKKSLADENGETSTAVADETPVSEPQPKKRKIPNDDGPANKRKKRNTLDGNDPKTSKGDDVAEEAVDVTPAKETPTASKKKKQGDSDAISNVKEQVSRSGRVIKPKKFADETAVEEDEKQKPATDQEDSKEELKEKKIKKPKPNKEAANESSEVVTPPPKKSFQLNPMGRIMWAKTKCGQLVQVKLDCDRPTTFKDQKARMYWEKSYSVQMKRVKQKIESGETLPMELIVQMKPTPERMATMSNEELAANKKQRVCERKKGKLRWLKLETRLVDLDVLIKTCLQKTAVDIDKALSLMDELINLPVDPLMLKKHPTLVDTAKKLRQYHGNVKDWEMSPDEEADFKDKAEKIRQKASILVHKFRSLFLVSKSDDFWSVFVNSVSEFNTLTKDLPRARLSSLTIDPTSPYYKEFAEYEEEEDELGLELSDSIKKAEEVKTS